jgi:membrane fusion protein, heavy metal efflux system
MTRLCRTTAALALTLAGVILAAACGRAASDADPAAAPATPAAGVTVSAGDAQASGIETVTTKTVERSDPLSAAGRVAFDERRTARIGSLVQGVVDELRFQPGDSVARGAVVARLHSHVVHDAWAMYFKALAEKKRVDAELAFAETAAKRAASLVADKALSAQELERARADVNAAAQAVAATRAEITRAEQELRHYGITPSPDADPLAQEDVPVVTPIGGTVIERLATEGSAVNPGSPLVVVSDLSQVWIAAEIDERLVGRVSPGRRVTIEAPAYPGESFGGTLTTVGDVVNAATRRVMLRVQAPNPGRRLKPEMLVTIAIAATAPRRVLVVPSRALQTMDGESVVFVRSGADQFVRRAVTTGATVSGEVEIVRGLVEGDVVATSGAFLLKSALTSPASEAP